MEFLLWALLNSKNSHFVCVSRFNIITLFDTTIDTHQELASCSDLLVLIIRIPKLGVKHWHRMSNINNNQYNQGRSLLIEGFSKTGIDPFMINYLARALPSVLFCFFLGPSRSVVGLSLSAFSFHRVVCEPTRVHTV
jgi:hypothetical protein